MKKILWFIPFLFIGCIGSENYYASKTAYYEAQAQANIAYIQASNKPLAEMTAPDGTRFVVNNTAIQAPVIHQANSPIVDSMKVILNSTPAAILSGGWAAKEIIKNSAGTLINSGDGTISSNSGNATTLTNGDPNNSVTDDHSAVADPTIVNQPDPIIARPEIVNQPEPIIVKPEIVEQPEPIIINNME